MEIGQKTAVGRDRGLTVELRNQPVYVLVHDEAQARFAIKALAVPARGRSTLNNPIGMVLIHAETLTDTWRRWPREKSAKELLSGSGLSVCDVESAFDPPCQPALPP